MTVLEQNISRLLDPSISPRQSDQGHAVWMDQLENNGSVVKHSSNFLESSDSWVNPCSPCAKGLQMIIYDSKLCLQSLC